MSMDASVVCGLAHAAETFVSRFSRYSLEHLAGTNIDAKFQGLEGTTGAGSDVGRCRRGRVIMVGFGFAQNPNNCQPLRGERAPAAIQDLQKP